eukprot:Nk52_evm25s2579 gene=Nk52_evmTU25s2579
MNNKAPIVVMVLFLLAGVATAVPKSEEYLNKLHDLEAKYEAVYDRFVTLSDSLDECNQKLLPARMDEGQKTFILSYANLQIRHGDPDDKKINGLGNLFVGIPGGDKPRTGSHNLVVGEYPTFMGLNGIIAGSSNYQGHGTYLSSVLGGYFNKVEVGAAGDTTYAVTVSGSGNTAKGVACVTIGGLLGRCEGHMSVLVGGHECVNTGAYSVITGSLRATTGGPYVVKPLPNNVDS